MAAAVTGRQLLLAASGVSYAVVFAAFLLYERPGLGLAHFFYLSIATTAIATGPRIGALAGLGATGLYALAIVLNPTIPSAEVLTASTAIRCVTFVSIGWVIGSFAGRNRAMLEELRILAERDLLTGLPNTRAFEAAITKRLEEGRPFALLLADMDALKELNHESGPSAGNEALRQVADRLSRSLSPEDQVARVGSDEFAVLASCQTLDDAADLSTRLEWVLSSQGTKATFGWAVHPQEGDNALAVYRAASERLYARKVMRGYVRGQAQRPRAVS
ncbi:MAG TPA: GGDEF domain-containing protein [Gaiellaceae bacterium]|nr:GGDEF domain-containing protein [Gaiellaceae bacterium]